MSPQAAKKSVFEKAYKATQKAYEGSGGDEDAAKGPDTWFRFIGIWIS